MKETYGYLPVIVIRLTEPAPEGNDLRELESVPATVVWRHCST